MSVTTTYPFTTSGNYTYPATIEVTGGVAQLIAVALAYPTTDPKIYPVAAINTDSLTSVSATIVAAGSDSVQFTMEIAGTEYYWDGSDWVASDLTFAQSNTHADITTNAAAMSSLLTNGKAIRPVAYLHSDDGSTTPQLDEVVVTYNLSAATPSTPTKCKVFGYFRDQYDSPIEDVIVTAQLADEYIYNSEIQMTKLSNGTTTNSSGYWELILIDTVNMDSGAYYEFKFLGDGIVQTVNRTVPASVSANFGTLTAP